jgi:DNA-binding transcriptional MerR regulator
VEKDADAFRTISEVGEDLDLPQHVLRFWETRFTQIKPVKRGGGRRYYRPDDVDLLRGIKHLLYAEGYTIKGVQRILREENPRFVQTVGREGRIPPSGEQTGHDQSADSFSADAGFDDMPDGLDEAVPAVVQQPVHPSSLEPVATPRRIEPAFGGSGAGPASGFGRENAPEPLHAPLAGQSRQEPSFAAPSPDHALFAPEPLEPVVPPRKVKPKQLALFEGMGDEGLSAKDREVLRQALERIDECRKILASADLAKLPQSADL